MLVMLCDGRIVCGCADPYAKRVLGDAKTTTIERIWKGSTIAQLRRDMNAAAATCRSSTGATFLFKWNDNDEEMDLARSTAVEIGVDRLCWEITDHPEDSFSRRFLRGTPAFESIRVETWDDSNLGNAIPGARRGILRHQGAHP